MSQEEKEKLLELFDEDHKYSSAEALFFLLIQTSGCSYETSIRDLCKQFKWCIRRVEKMLDYIVEIGLLIVERTRTRTIVKRNTNENSCENTCENTCENSCNFVIDCFTSSLNTNNSSCENTNENSCENTCENTKERNKEKVSSPITLSIKEINKEKKEPKNNKLFLEEKPKQGSLEVNKEDCERREEEFYQSLIPFLDQYDKDLLRNFYDYWSEWDKNKKKMRYELQKTWQTSKRLATWYRKNNPKWKGTY